MPAPRFDFKDFRDWVIATFPDLMGPAHNEGCSNPILFMYGSADFAEIQYRGWEVVGPTYVYGPVSVMRFIAWINKKGKFKQLKAILGNNAHSAYEAAVSLDYAITSGGGILNAADPEEKAMMDRWVTAGLMTNAELEELLSAGYRYTSMAEHAGWYDPFNYGTHNNFFAGDVTEVFLHHCWTEAGQELEFHPEDGTYTVMEL
jgi:hypothetical protein